MSTIRPFMAAVFASLLLVSAQAFAQTVRQEPLAEVRSQIVFPELSLSEKQVMVEQAQIFLRDLYVHRYEKLDFYPSLVDPVPEIAAIAENIESLSSTEMEEAIYTIFVSQRDLHLNYIFPAPYSNFRSFLPLTFTRTASEDNFFEVRVASVNAELFSRFAPNARIPQVGDLVRRYNRMPIRQAVREQLKTAQGANQYGGFTRALGQMTFVPHRLHLVPEENEVVMTFESHVSAERYRISLPWISEFTEAAPSLRARNVDQAPRRFNKDDLTQGIDLWQDMFNDFVSQNDLAPKSEYPSNPSSEPVLKWGIIDNEFGKYAYLNLQSFVPENGTDEAIAEIERLIFEEFADTEGLVFDVRNNGGGNIIFADKLSQLFTPKQARAINARLLNTDLNRRILNETNLGFFSNPEWTQVINEAAGSAAIHTELAPFSYTEDANRLGQIYYKPVAVLNNARSYSATDLFSCAMQDNGAALLYGEDPRTGAGGANVLTHAAFNFYLPEVFEPLPLDHAMRVSWRQSVRFGPNEGRVIEDFGCRADIDVSQELGDILYGNVPQIKAISKSLLIRSKEDRYRPSARPLQSARKILVDRENSVYTLGVTDTDIVRVSVGGEQVAELMLYINEETLVDFTMSDYLSAGLSFVTFEGLSWDGMLQWNLKRQFTILDSKVEVGPEGFEKDFSTSDTIAPFAILNANAPEDGWNLVGPNLQIGYSPQYADNVDSDAVLLLNLSARETAALTFDMEFATELDYDFIEVAVSDAQGNRRVYLRQSGTQAQTSFTYDITEFAGKDNVVLHFRFTSDSLVTAPGVKLQRVGIR